MSLPDISENTITNLMFTYSRDQAPYFIRKAFHILILPSRREVYIPVARVRLPPKCGVDRSAAAQNTSNLDQFFTRIQWFS
jgi:hypothetical protein